jgi:recombinational DNA repair protein (RecF pathway)
MFFKAKHNHTKPFLASDQKQHFIHQNTWENISKNTKLFFISFSKTKPYNTFPFCPKAQKQPRFPKPNNISSCN